jgi:hypothetical protein
MGNGSTAKERDHPLRLDKQVTQCPAKDFERHLEECWAGRGSGKLVGKGRMRIHVTTFINLIL